MTIYRNLNVAGWGGNYTTWTLIKTLLAAGWTCEASSSGSDGGSHVGIYSATQNVFSMTTNPVVGSSVVVGVGIGDEHWGNADCWILLEDPSTHHQLALRRAEFYGSSYDQYWACAYSPGALFTGGGLTTPPTASDQVIPSGMTYPDETAVHISGGTANLIHCCASNLPSDAGEYGFFLVELKATNTVQSVIMIDDVYNLGSNPDANVITYKATAFTSSAITTNTFARTKGSEGGWDSVKGCTITGLYPSSGGTDPYDSKERAGIVHWKNDTRSRACGISRWLRWAGVDHSYPAISDDLKHLIIGEVLVVDLFDGASTPLAI